jgi:hypothetical protein
MTMHHNTDSRKLPHEHERRQCDSYRRSLFLVEYEGKTVVVKFCEQYGEDANMALADAGLAPRLHYLFKVVGIHGGDGLRRRSGRL